MDMPKILDFVAENRWVFIVLWLVVMALILKTAKSVLTPTKHTGTTIKFRLSKSQKALIKSASIKAHIKANSVFPFCISVEDCVIHESTEFSEWTNILNEEMPIGTLTVDKNDVYIEMTANHEMYAEVHSSTFEKVFIAVCFLFIVFFVTLMGLGGYFL